MLKNIAMVRSECTSKHKNKASYNIDYIVSDLIDFFDNIKKRSENRPKNIVVTKNFFLSIFHEFPEHYKEK